MDGRMVQFKWIKMLSYLILVPDIAAKTTHYLSVIIRDGAEATLPCRNVLTDHSNCDSTTWTLSQLTGTAAVDLVKGGQIWDRTINKSDRLRVAADCSLVIKNATQEDVGRYFCIQEKSGRRHPGEAVVDVSVVTLTEKKEREVVLLKCRLLTRLLCTHTVEWLPPGPEVDQDFRKLRKLQSMCVAMVTFSTSDSVFTSKKYESLQCNLKEHNSNRSLQFTFNPQSSERNTPLDIGTTTTKPEGLWWVYIIVAVGLTALFITGAVLLRRKRNKGNKTQTDKNQADPDDGVSYVSIDHTKKTKSKARVWGCEDTVTYTTVKASSAADPINLYATIN